MAPYQSIGAAQTPDVPFRAVRVIHANIPDRGLGNVNTSICRTASTLLDNLLDNLKPHIRLTTLNTLLYLIVLIFTCLLAIWESRAA
jgi:hypothetical protein